MLTAVLVALAIRVTCPTCHLYYNPLETLTEARLTQVLYVAAARTHIHVSRGGMRASRRICQKESNYDPQCRMQGSTSYGLFGFLDATWKTYGVTKTSCPYCQSRAFLLYVYRRYGSPERALEYHRRKGWY